MRPFGNPGRYTVEREEEALIAILN